MADPWRRFLMSNLARVLAPILVRALAPGVAGATVLAAVLGLGGGQVLGGLAFTPHRAVYDMRLNPSVSDGSVTQASGKLEFEWADLCSGWTVEQRSRIRMVSSLGQVTEFGWSLKSFETGDGRRYRYFLRRFHGDAPPEAVNGSAELSGIGQGGVARYREPAAREVVLPKGTLFPTAHTLLLLEAAKRGEFPIWRTVFDGSGEDGLFGISAALSQALPAGAEVGLDSALLRGQDSWRLHLAYFGTEAGDSEPKQELSLRLFANGVVDEMLLDYGTFALNADLEVLEALPAPDC